MKLHLVYVWFDDYDGIDDDDDDDEGKTISVSFHMA